MFNRSLVEPDGLGPKISIGALMLLMLMAGRPSERVVAPYARFAWTDPSGTVRIGPTGTLGQASQCRDPAGGGERAMAAREINWQGGTRWVGTSNHCLLGTAGDRHRFPGCLPALFSWHLFTPPPSVCPLVAMPECIVKPRRESDTPVDWGAALVRTATFNIDIHECHLTEALE